MARIIMPMLTSFVAGQIAMKLSMLYGSFQRIRHADRYGTRPQHLRGDTPEIFLPFFQYF